jgi:outer membrane protein TolC
MIVRLRFPALLLVFLCSPLAFAQKLTLQRAVELGMANGPSVLMGNADVTHAQKGLSEARNAYVPQVIFGSGLGKSFGFPMSIEGSAPSVFQVNVQSFLYNPAQQQFVRAARTDITAANFSAQELRNQAALPGRRLALARRETRQPHPCAHASSFR